MLKTNLSYEDWKDFFTKRLVNSGAFRLLDTISKGHTDIDIYAALSGDLETKIQVGSFSPTTLIYMHILNPATPGKNRQQQIEHFYKYEFDGEKQYGPPGLDFDEINVRAISNYLNQGFNGTETGYYRNGQPVKSRLTTSYYPDSPQSTFTYHFRKELFFRKLVDKITGRHDEYDEVTTIELREVFSGLNGS